VTDNPGNGGKRFDDLANEVHNMRDDLRDALIEMREMRVLLRERPCVTHSTQLHDLELRQTRTESGTQISVAKVAGMSAIVSAIVSSIGAYFIARGH